MNLHNAILADSSGLLALVNKKDAFHQAVKPFATANLLVSSLNPNVQNYPYQPMRVLFLFRSAKSRGRSLLGQCHFAVRLARDLARVFGGQPQSHKTASPSQCNGILPQPNEHKVCLYRTWFFVRAMLIIVLANKGAWREKAAKIGLYGCFGVNHDAVVKALDETLWCVKKTPSRYKLEQWRALEANVVGNLALQKPLGVV
jgi:hypothetical protein